MEMQPTQWTHQNTNLQPSVVEILQNLVYISREHAESVNVRFALHAWLHPWLVATEIDMKAH